MLPVPTIARGRMGALCCWAMMTPPFLNAFAAAEVTLAPSAKTTSELPWLSAAPEAALMVCDRRQRGRRAPSEDSGGSIQEWGWRRAPVWRGTGRVAGERRRGT